jgi:chemotaxis protein MotB
MRAERVAPGRWPGRCGLMWLLLMVPALVGATSDTNDQALQQLLEQTRSQLHKVSQHADATAAELALLRERLGEAAQRNRRQTERIEALNRKVSELARKTPEQREYWRQLVFAALAQRLPHSRIAQVRGERLLIPTDPVFVFGTGELGAEGQDRLLPVASALVAALNTLPPDLQWRLEVAGHTDRRPLRGNARFPSNWELSSARAVAVLRFLYRQGLGKRRLLAAGYGDTAPLDEANSKAAFRRNRRVEIRLVFPD